MSFLLIGTSVLMMDTSHHESTKAGKHEIYLVFFEFWSFPDLSFWIPVRPG
jgi:hypothetical protein